MPFSFSERLLGDRKSHIYLVHGTDQQRKAWYYISVDPLKLSLFCKQPLGQDIALDQYGTVLECGWGAEPPEAIRMKYDSANEPN